MAFWDYFFKKKTESSASHAVDRIKFVLQSDRTGLPQETLERIKNDIISVLSKYVDIETAELDFNITKAPNEHGAMTPALCANIPIKGVKRNSPADNAKVAASTTEAAKSATSSTEGTKSTEITKSGAASDSSNSSVSNAVSDSTKSADATKGNTSLPGAKSAEDVSDTVKNIAGVSNTAKSTTGVTDSAKPTTGITETTTTVKTTAAKAVESGKKTDDDGSGLSSALDKTFVFKKD